jgi:acetylornithine deacetylase/succinyl-diaminopimelate desuccinylase-like protein
MTSAFDYAAQHQERFVRQLADWLRIPSVSTDPAFKHDVLRAAQWLAEDMRRSGLENVTIMETGGHPVVYADWLHAGSDKPTVLVYGHYDVQPAAVEDGWTYPPFEPVIREDRIIARGSSDDKGQVMIQLKAVESLLKTGTCPVNVKYLIEGEEESGSTNLTRFINEHKALLKADLCLISDTGIRSVDQPVIVYGLRGILSMELIITGPKRDLHSGAGGNIHNPAQALCEIVAQLHHPDGSVAVPSFYDRVAALSEQERALLNRADDTEEEWEAYMGDLPVWGEPGFSRVERRGARPTLEVNGLASGYAGEGFKTVLPARAVAKLSCRLVPHQDPREIFHLVQARVAELTPPTVRTELKMLDYGFPAVTPIDHPATQAAVRAYSAHFPREPLFVRGGGSIPVVADVQTLLGLPVVLLGFALPDSSAHGPDENFSLEMYGKGIKTVITYLHEVAALRP